MSSIVNNSNSNSALINTINASSSKMNPDVYSTKTIYPASATVYQKTDSNSGSIGDGKTLSFQLLKYGIAQQILLTYSKGQLHGTKSFDFLEVIDRIELLSSSKVVDTLTNKDILAQISDLTFTQFSPINSSLITFRPINQNGAALKYFFTLPLVFGFMKQVNTNLNLQFNENMSIRVKFGPNSGLSFTDGTANAVQDCYLNVRYKNYNEADYSEILTQNYNEPELSQMVTGFYDENTAIATIAANATSNGTNGTPVELKNTDCVNSFYVMVREQQTAPAEPQEAVPIQRVVMTASGQTIFDLNADEFRYSRLCSNGFSIAGDSTSSSGNVVKIQCGLWAGGPHGGPQSNTMSLRELNNPIITVYFNVAAENAERKYEVDVVEDALKIVSTVSSSGRVSVALTN
jgi:hypothetical protein